MGPELKTRIFCHNIIYGNVYFTWIESTRPKQMLRRPMAAITTRVRCSIFPSLSNNDDEEDDDDCWRLMMTKTTLHFWRLTHENQTGRKRSDWHTKISASERVTLTGAARLRTLVFWELRKVLITLKYISCFVTSWAFHLSSLQVVARPLFSFLDNGGKNF